MPTPHLADPHDAAQLLALVDALVRELHPGAMRRATLDCALDRDLGLDSLSRVELLARIERHYGVRLPTTVLDSAETPRDLTRRPESKLAQHRARRGVVEEMARRQLRHVHRARDVDELAPRLGEIGLTPPEQPRRLALAAFYKLVQRIDEDPQLALALRQPPGRTQRSPTRAATRFVPLSALDPARFFVAPRA